MKRLEEFTRANQDQFNNELPPENLWGKIEADLEKKSVRPFSKLGIWTSVAAVLLVALLTTIVLSQKDEQIERYTHKIDPELQELIEAEAYYSAMVSGKMAEIEKCYQVYPELKSDIEDDLNDLDNMYQELKGDLNDNFYNREVIEAMIQNKRVKLEMVNRVLNQINC